MTQFRRWRDVKARREAQDQIPAGLNVLMLWTGLVARVNVGPDGDVVSFDADMVEYVQGDVLQTTVKWPPSAPVRNAELLADGARFFWFSGFRYVDEDRVSSGCLVFRGPDDEV